MAPRKGDSGELRPLLVSEEDAEIWDQIVSEKKLKNRRKASRDIYRDEFLRSLSNKSGSLTALAIAAAFIWGGKFVGAFLWDLLQAIAGSTQGPK